MAAQSAGGQWFAPAEMPISFLRWVFLRRKHLALPEAEPAPFSLPAFAPPARAA
jgi:hypothetical protein